MTAPGQDAPALPDGWEWKPLGQLAATSSGGTPSRRRSDFYESGSIPWVKIGDLTEGLVLESEEKITHAALSASSGKVLPVGTLMIAMYGASIGRLGILGIEAATNQAICALQTDDGTLRDYLYWYLLAARPRLVAAGYGGAQPNISQAFLKTFPVPLAPHDERVRIIEALAGLTEALNAGDADLRRAVEGTTALQRAVLQEAAMQGEPGTIGDVLDGIEGGKSFRCHGYPAAEGAWGVIKVSAMTWGEFRQEENKEVLSAEKVDPRWEIRQGDVLISRANTSEYVGASVLVRQTRPQLLLSDKSLRLMPKENAVPAWLQLVLSAPSSRKQMSQSATGTSDSMRNLSQDKIRAVTIRIPEPDTQEALAASVQSRMHEIDGLRLELQQQLMRAATLRQLVLERAFTGALGTSSSEQTSPQTATDSEDGGSNG